MSVLCAEPWLLSAPEALSAVLKGLNEKGAVLKAETMPAGEGGEEMRAEESFPGSENLLQIFAGPRKRQSDEMGFSLKMTPTSFPVTKTSGKE